MLRPFTEGEILHRFKTKKQLFAILIDPDKTKPSLIPKIIASLPKNTTHIFVGGSIVKKGDTKALVVALKHYTSLPIILFPGDASQVTNEADGLLFLSLLSGRNPEFLIEQHIKAVPYLRTMSLEIIPTAYLLIDGGKETEVQRVSKTTPMPQDNIEHIVNTALAAQYSGKKLLYLEAGSGAKIPVSPSIIKAVTSAVTIPVIVGGGITNKTAISLAYQNGATMVVVGTAFEKKMS